MPIQPGTLRTRCAFLQINRHDDGNNVILAVRRKTLDDGRVPDPRFVEGETYDRWWVELAPPAPLVGKYKRGEISQEEFAKKYSEYMDAPEAKAEIEKLIALAMEEGVTITCVEPKGQFCHRLLLAERCHQLQPLLRIEHA